ncbi:MAG: hypothetical protein V4513_11000 [Pseudomonadota bacterium]
MARKSPRHWFDRYAMFCFNNRGAPILIPALIFLGAFFFFDTGPGARPRWWEIGFAAVCVIVAAIFVAVMWRAVAIEVKPFWREAEKGRRH